MKKGETGKNKEKKKIRWFIFLGILIILFLIIFGTKIYLLIKFLIGNDIIINVEADKKNIFLLNDEERIINLKTSIISNPFCSASCSYEFIDISNNLSIDKQNGDIKTSNNFKGKYTLIAPAKGTGQRLYRWDVQCKSMGSFLCQTSEELNKRTLLITLDYNLSENEQEQKKIFEESYLDITKNPAERVFFLKQIEVKLNGTLLDTKESQSQIDLFENFSNLINKTLVFWDNQEYSLANDLLIKTKKDYELIENNFQIFNKTLYETIDKHNRLSLFFEQLVNNVSNITTIYLNETEIQIGGGIVVSTNKIIDNLKNNSIISQEFNIFEVENKTNMFLSLERNNSLEQKKINISLKKYNSLLINLNFSISEQNQTLREPNSKCCLFNKCDSCCDETCYNNPKKYPIMFIHGHDFSSSISPEYNLNIFEEMQRAIEDKGYINSGSLILGNSGTAGLLGKTNNPVSIRASYYFDSIQESGKTNVLYTKQDNIDTYAIRLKEIIEEVKIETNKEKVILVTHSMGGLVARRYLQIFGGNSVYEIILIAAPNHGISKDLYDSCKLFGSNNECDDMYEKSLLISKLNTQKDVGETKIYNIVGLGCETYGEDGDGVVEKSSAFLSFADNYYLNGSCDAHFDYFHNKIINPLKTPEIKELVLNLLNQT